MPNCRANQKLRRAHDRRLASGRIIRIPAHCVKTSRKSARIRVKKDCPPCVSEGVSQQEFDRLLRLKNQAVVVQEQIAERLVEELNARQEDLDFHHRELSEALKQAKKSKDSAANVVELQRLLATAETEKEQLRAVVRYTQEVSVAAQRTSASILAASERAREEAEAAVAAVQNAAESALRQKNQIIAENVREMQNVRQQLHEKEQELSTAELAGIETIATLRESLEKLKAFKRQHAETLKELGKYQRSAEKSRRELAGERENLLRLNHQIAALQEESRETSQELLDKLAESQEAVSEKESELQQLQNQLDSTQESLDEQTRKTAAAIRRAETEAQLARAAEAEQENNFREQVAALQQVQEIQKQNAEIESRARQLEEDKAVYAVDLAGLKELVKQQRRNYEELSAEYQRDVNELRQKLFATEEARIQAETSRKQAQLESELQEVLTTETGTQVSGASVDSSFATESLRDILRNALESSEAIAESAAMEVVLAESEQKSGEEVFETIDLLSPEEKQAEANRKAAELAQYARAAKLGDSDALSGFVGQGGFVDELSKLFGFA